MKKKCGRATASSGSKARDVVTLGYTCCHFLSIHELLCHSFKYVFCCLNLNAVLGIFKIMPIHPFYLFFFTMAFFFLIFLKYSNFLHSAWIGSVKHGSSWWLYNSMALMKRHSTGKKLFKINKEQFLSIFIFREVHLLKFPRTHWAFTKYLNRLRGHSGPPVDTREFSMEKQECQEKKAALTSWQMHVVTASLDRAHVLLKEVGFCHNNLNLNSLVLKGTYDKIRSSRVVCRAFQEKPRPLSLSSAQSLHY